MIHFCYVGIKFNTIQVVHDWENTVLCQLIPIGPLLLNLVSVCSIYRLVDMSCFLTFQLILNSMHKYQPRVHIIRKRDHTASVINLKSEEMKTFTFAETNFIGVTAYQNQLVSNSAEVFYKIFPIRKSHLAFIKFFGSLLETDKPWNNKTLLPGFILIELSFN